VHFLDQHRQTVRERGLADGESIRVRASGHRLIIQALSEGGPAPAPICTRIRRSATGDPLAGFPMADWKHTLNLPRTAFPMKANLQATEPQMIARWEASNLYGRIRTARAGEPLFVLHDGPPYANAASISAPP